MGIGLAALSGWPRPRRAAVVAVAALVPFCLLWLAVAGDRGWVVETDLDVGRDVHGAVRDHPLLVDFTAVVTELGTSWSLYLVVVAVAAVAIVRRQAWLAVFAIVASVGGGLLNRGMKELVGRERPSFPDPLAVGGGDAFPSGHAMNSIIVLVMGALAVGVLASRWRGAALVIAGVGTAAIGASRVVLGVHHPSDVLGGWLLGIAWLATLTAGVGVMMRRPFVAARQ